MFCMSNIKKNRRMSRKLKKIRLNSLISNLSTYEAKRLTKLVFNWCLDHLGENFRKKNKDLEVELDYTLNPDCYGEYLIEEDRRVIIIYMNHNKTVAHFVETCLHEFSHDLLPDSKYEILQKKYGYKNHPHEKKANKISERFTYVCWNDIMCKVNSQICKR